MKGWNHANFTVPGWMALLLIVAAPMTAAGAGGKAAPKEDPYVAPPSAPASITEASGGQWAPYPGGGLISPLGVGSVIRPVAAPIDKRTTTHTFRARRHWLLLSTDGGSTIVELAPRRTTLTFTSRGTSAASVGAGGLPSHLARPTWLLGRGAPWAGLRLEGPVPPVGLRLASGG